MIRQELGITTLAASHIALYTQCGYALGLLFPHPACRSLQPAAHSAYRLFAVDPCAAGYGSGLADPYHPPLFVRHRSLLRGAAVLHSPRGAVFAARTEEPQRGDCPFGTADRNPRFAGGQRGCRGVARVARDVSYRLGVDAPLRRGCLPHPSRCEAQFHGQLRRTDAFALLAARRVSAPEGSFGPGCARFRIVHVFLGLARLQDGAASVPCRE